MKYHVEIESEVDDRGIKKPYDIFSNCHKDLPRAVGAHIHSYYEAALVLEGRITYRGGDAAPVELVAGDIIFIPPNTVHSTYAASSDSGEVRSIVVKFSPIFLYPMETTPSDADLLLMPQVYSEPCYLFPHGEERTEELAEIMRRILRERIEERAGYELALRGELTSLYILFARNCREDNEKSTRGDNDGEIEIDSASAQKLHRVFTYVKENYQGNISMQQAADVLGMNYYSFSRFFKRVSGRSFNDHLLEVRLNNSQKKLLQSDMPISDVALSCGFEYPSYFIRKFKSKYGMTPKEYREKYR